MTDPDPLLNLKDYTPLELALFGVGCFMWVGVYAIFLKQIYKDRFVEMPVVAALSNIAWELLWAFCFQPDVGRLIYRSYQGWAFLDLVIIVGVLRYGHWQISSPEIKRHYVPICLATWGAFGLTYYMFTASGHDTPIGANSAYIAQLFISVLYILLFVKTPSLEKFSAWVLWLRTIGTGLNTIFMFVHYSSLHYPEPRFGFLHTIAATSTLLDVFCIFYYYRRKRGEAWAKK